MLGFQENIAEPTGTNMPVPLTNLYLLARKRLVNTTVSLARFTFGMTYKVSGKRHRWEPLRHTIPKEER